MSLSNMKNFSFVMRNIVILNFQNALKVKIINSNILTKIDIVDF